MFFKKFLEKKELICYTKKPKQEFIEKDELE